MKKFLFIIPKVLFKFTILVALICSNTKLNAQIYGCHVVVGMSDRIFYTPYGAGSPLEWQTIPSGTITATGETGGYRSDGSATYGCIADIGGTCVVYQQYEVSPGPPQIIGMRPYRTGVYASIDPLNCPIDDFVPLMITCVAAIGFFRIRKFAIFKSANESKYNHSSL